MKLPLDGIDIAQVAKALAKVHESAPHTGRRTLAGIARVFDYARVKGLIDARRPNPATFRGGFEHLWGPPEPTTHLRAVGYERVPELYGQLCDLEDMTAAWCLRLLILTGVRTSNALYARFDEIDLKAGTWTIQPEDMKKNEKMKDRPKFVVPLVDEAVAIVTTMRERWPAGELIFPSDRHFGKQHPRALAYVLQYVLGVEASVHGFRSSLRDFLGDRTNVEREVAEMCLAHFAKGVEAAYRRSTALEKRRIALSLWARHVVGEGEADTVVPFRQASA
jgi:integrase